MKIIKFLARVSPYQPNETAGFPDEVAKSYVDAKKAEYVNAGKAGKKGSATTEPDAGTSGSKDETATGASEA